jgi:hypothetical protein
LPGMVNNINKHSPKFFGAFLYGGGITSLLLFCFLFFTALLSFWHRPVLASDFPNPPETNKPGKLSFVFTADGTAGPFQLPHKYLLIGTVQVLDEDRELNINVDYLVDYDTGTLTFTGVIPKSGDKITVSYLYFPLQELLGTKETAAEKYAPGEGGKLEVNGSKSFTVSAENGGNVTLDQATRIRFQGEVGQLNVEGRLTDEQLPLVPEGTSEELANIDEVYVKINGPGFYSQLGDIQVERQNTAFANFNKHLLGITVGGDISGQELMLSLTRAKSQHYTQELTAIAGVQGPYFLAVPDQVGISVIPGSERVFLNGELMRRGETNDYTIDYTSPSITFTSFRPLYVGDQLVVEFEYTNLGYKRTFFDSGARFFTRDRSLGASIYFTQESDNKDEDLVGLSDEEKKILANAGDDPTKAIVPVFDADGKPLYTYVGEGKGDYTRQWNPQTQSYDYSLVGEGKGDWTRTTVSLPMPKKQQLGDLILNYNPNPWLNFNAELAASDLDRNLFSILNDNDNIGYALQMNLVSAFRMHGWKLSFSPDWLSRGTEFMPIEGLEEASFRREWEMEGETSEGGKQPSLQMLGGTIGLSRTNSFTSEVSYQSMIRRYPHSFHLAYDRVLAKKLTVKTVWGEGTDGALKFNLRRLTQITSWTGKEDWEYGSQDLPLYSTILDWQVDADHRLSVFRPGISGGELVKKGEMGYLGLIKGVIRREVRPRLEFDPWSWLSTSYGYGISREKAVQDSRWQRYSKSKEYFSGLTITGGDKFFWQANYSRQSTDYTDINLADTASDLVRSQFRLSPWGRALFANLRYSASSDLDFEREEAFEVAEDGNGDYRRIPDPENPGGWKYIYDPDNEDSIYIRILRPTGASFRILDVEGYLSTTLDFSQVLGKKETPGWFTGMLSQMRWEASISAQEKSVDPNHFRVLLFLSRLNGKTIYGSLNQSYSLTLFPQSVRFSPTLGYEERESLDNAVTNQSKWYLSRGIFLRTFSSPYPRVELATRTDFSREWDKYSSTGLEVIRTSRLDTLSWEVTPKYRPLSSLTISVGFLGDYIQEWDDDIFGTIKSFSLQPSSTIRVSRSGTLTLGYLLEKVIVNNAYGSKYLITHPEGLSHKFNAGYRHQLSKYLTATVSYEAEKQPDLKIKNKARVDFSAYF